MKYVCCAHRAKLVFFLLVTALFNRLILIQNHVQRCEVSSLVSFLTWLKMDTCVCGVVCVCDVCAYLSRFALSVMVASKNELGSVPSSVIFWEEFQKNRHFLFLM